MVGDDQTVLECVLQADVERTVLLEEEKTLKGETTCWDVLGGLHGIDILSNCIIMSYHIMSYGM